MQKTPEHHPLLKQSEFFGKKLGLESINQLINHFKIDFKDQYIVHIAGTNGKGSVAKMLATSLHYLNKSVGLFTSPHLISVTERIQTNNKPITSPRFFEILDQIEQEIRTTSLECSPTYFETCLLAALLEFSNQKVSYIILETGLGGRLDATNAVNSHLQIITSISKDHTQFLGNTLPRIAEEKFGILKNHSNIILCKLPNRQLKRLPLLTNVEFHSESKSFRCDKSKKKNTQYVYRSSGPLNHFHFSNALLGDFQKQNSSIVLKALEVICKKTNLVLKRKFLQKAFSEVRWPGRLEVIKQNPLCILDSAHNLEAAKKLMANISQLFPNKVFIGIATFSNDKNYTEILKTISPVVKECFLVPHPDKNRGLNWSNEFKQNRFLRQQKKFKESKNLELLWNKLILQNKNCDYLFFGSVYFSAQIYKFFKLDLPQN